ncbi:fkbp-type peptidyl-prolyl cis-trans isomerase fkpa [Holotrichia oblita]|uniref:Fkbp-type peptidyl-prolyl cis-trans isomerase fkpa n=1 Tax=Holotrichia oblita TaxID=644536 RepID=A0ACB9TR87_HOLOL|nr:fkbp-type peptidyl-prolyl cis-trans isomerase fkpa [Holotrichia oblita]
MTDSTLNPKLIAAGLIDAFEGRSKVTREDATKFLQEYFMVRLPAKRLKESEEFISQIEEKNRNNADFGRTESGLLYQIIRPGSSERPTSELDKVRVTYVGTFKNGTEFDSSKDTVEFALNRVIRGWTEGLQLIGKGGEIRLWIPPDLAYGQYGRGNIGPNEALVFDINLIDFTPAQTQEETPAMSPGM